MGVVACAPGGDDGRQLLMCCAPDFYGHTRAPVRTVVLVSTEVAVPHAGLPWTGHGLSDPCRSNGTDELNGEEPP